MRRSGTPPIKQRFQLPQEVLQHHRQADRRDHQSQGSRGRRQIHAEPVRPQAQRRRQPGGAGDPNLGPQFKRAHADLLRRSADLGADRQQQFGRLAALESDFAGSDRADRFSQRPVRGRLSRQFHRRRAADHLEDAGQAVRGRQGDGVGHAVESIRHQGHLCEQPDQRGGRRPQGRVVMAASAPTIRTAISSR